MVRLLDKRLDFLPARTLCRVVLSYRLLHHIHIFRVACFLRHYGRKKTNYFRNRTRDDEAANKQKHESPLIRRRCARLCEWRADAIRTKAAAFVERERANPAEIASQLLSRAIAKRTAMMASTRDPVSIEDVSWGQGPCLT
jgi:hypothetical protein